MMARQSRWNRRCLERILSKHFLVVVVDVRHTSVLVIAKLNQFQSMICACWPLHQTAALFSAHSRHESRTLLFPCTVSGFYPIIVPYYQTTRKTKKTARTGPSLKDRSSQPPNLCKSMACRTPQESVQYYYATRDGKGTRMGRTIPYNHIRHVTLSAGICWQYCFEPGSVVRYRQESNALLTRLWNF